MKSCGTQLSQIKFSTDIFSSINRWYFSLLLHSETSISVMQLINANVWIRLPSYLLLTITPHQFHKLINSYLSKTLYINSTVHSHIQMTMNDISKAKPCYITKGQHTEERRWTCSDKQIQRWVDRCLVCFSHYRFSTIPGSLLLIAVDIHTLKHPQNCSIETGGPLTAHNVGSIRPVSCSVLMGWKQKSLSAGKQKDKN